MARTWIFTALVLLSITAVARTQYFDLLQGLQQLLQPYQPNKQNIDITRSPPDKQTRKENRTKTPDEKRTSETRKNKRPLYQFDFLFTTNKPRKTIKNFSDTKIIDKNFSFESTTKSNRYKSTTRVIDNNRVTPNNKETKQRESTTEVTLNIDNQPSSLRKEKYVVANEAENNFDLSKVTINNTDFTKKNLNKGVLDEQSNRNNGSTNSGIPNNWDLYNNENYDRPHTAGTRNVNVANLINDPITNIDQSGDGDDVGDRRVTPNNSDFPTPNPLANRPGLRPSPATNRPVSDSIYFPSSGGSSEPETPDLLIGPDEDDMTSLQKRRYIDLAERMCDTYKALNVKKLAPLPLIPSPDPVEFNVTSCNRVSVPLVVGGKKVSITEFPHMALVGWKIIRTSGYSWKCGASLISDQYLLTAGHCTYQDKDYDVVSGPPQAVQLGSTYLDDTGATVVKINSVIRHPKYKRRRAYHDIALLKMVRRVSFSEVIKPACIGPPPSVGNIVATGWGRTEFGGDHSEELRSVSLPIWNLQECIEVWGESPRLPSGVTSESHLCAGERSGGKDTCQGDSGGPAQMQDGCVWRVIAVTSFGRSCASPNTPALYAVIPRAFVAAQVFGEDVDYGGRGDATNRWRVIV